jgi:Zn-dependent protease with chaperone function
MSRVPLNQISPRAWEHPADRAALNALKAIPGFDDVVRKVATFFGERGVRQLFLANAVRVGPRQRPKLNALYTEVLETMDWPRRPQLYVSQNPVANAVSVGFEDPFIVIHSESLEILGREEHRFVLAHEVAHVMSGHTTYRTIAYLLLMFGVGSLPFLAGMALMPFQLALLDWHRKSELSCDRAGLLGVQDPNVAMSTFLRMAGGDASKAGGDDSSLEEFIQQAADYETGGTAWDTVLKLVNTAFREHPFATVRASELLRWQRGGDYERILAGDYPRRGDDDGSLRGDFREAASSYRDESREAFRPIGDALRNAKDAFTDRFRRGGSDT